MKAEDLVLEKNISADSECVCIRACMRVWKKSRTLKTEGELSPYN